MINSNFCFQLISYNYMLPLFCQDEINSLFYEMRKAWEDQNSIEKLANAMRVSFNPLESSANNWFLFLRAELPLIVNSYRLFDRSNILLPSPSLAKREIFFGNKSDICSTVMNPCSLHWYLWTIFIYSHTVNNSFLLTIFLFYSWLSP